MKNLSSKTKSAIINGATTGAIIAFSVFSLTLAYQQFDSSDHVKNNCEKTDLVATHYIRTYNVYDCSKAD